MGRIIHLLCEKEKFLALPDLQKAHFMKLGQR